ncbi:MAG: methyl-accepting chemotaxis protein [Thermoleophilaceae bacterium]|jgi:methyl-accepting chemotaxis protein|nr:methyl-accepting chemotaxis protein [Thermoleophilaceae bacterium]
MRALRGERGLAPALLVVVIAWALAAVLMLTGTILSAQRIEGDVGKIVGSTSEIDGDLDSVRLAAETTRISTDILTSAKPLVGQLDQVIVSARSIDREGRSILDTAQSINGDAVSINATAGAINSEVRSINATADSINANVTSILSSARGIESTADSINAKVTSINGRVNNIDASVDSINPRLAGTLDEGRTIDSGVSGINGRGDRVIELVRPIRRDFANILDEVGQPSLDRGHRQRSGDKSIDGHANSIDCQVDNLRDLPPPITSGSPGGPPGCNRF